MPRNIEMIRNYTEVPVTPLGVTGTSISAKGSPAVDSHPSRDRQEERSRSMCATFSANMDALAISER